MTPNHKGHSKQRMQILEFLMESGEHPTAAEIAEGMAEIYGPVSTSNLYRNLDILVSTGHLRRVRFDDGPDRFDANVLPHYHVMCTFCGHIWDMPVRDGDRCDLTLPNGFRPETWDITIKGLCARCAKSPHPFQTKEEKDA